VLALKVGLEAALLSEVASAARWAAR